MHIQNFNKDWHYTLEGSGSWQGVELPHDAMLHAGRDPKSPGKDANGYYVGGVYHYEKTFHAPAEWAGKTVAVAFGGVYRNAVVSLNGREVGRRAYGYIPFEVCLDGALRYGEENTLTVMADNSELPNSRWYSGGGIYRDVKLLTADKSHIPYRGVQITVLSHDPAVVRVDTRVCVADGADCQVLVELSKDGEVVAWGQGSSLELTIPGARLWSAETPELYGWQVRLVCGGRETDRAQGHFGIRTLQWSPQGFLVNGKQVLFQGACVHHDNGLLGACSYAEAEERKVRILKEQGFNALRISHNPASDALLEACDRLGMYVMDESFDMWYQSKNKYDYSRDFRTWYLEDTRAMVERGYNHPSVVMYSIGNEVSEPAREEGLACAREMIDLIHSLDVTRPVTAGINLMIVMMSAQGKGLYDDGGAAKAYAEKSAADAEAEKAGKRKESPSGSLMFNMMMTMMGKGLNRVANSQKADRTTAPILDMLDIAGYNYASGRYPKEGKLHPNRIVVGSETYPQDIWDNWDMVKKYPYLIGDFMWTGWDYLGEAAIGAWNYEGVSMMNVRYPWMLAGAGTVDILGRPDASAKYAACVWGALDGPYIGVTPLNHRGIRVTKSAWRGTNAMDSWAWAGCQGNPGSAEVYAPVGDRAELLLNGKSLGKKRIRKNKAVFPVKYAPGRLEAVITDGSGREVGRTCLVSAEKAEVRVIPEKEQVSLDSIAYVSVRICDDAGVVESNADRELRVQVENGELLGFGSGNPAPRHPFTGDVTATFYGYAQAIVRCSKPGVVTVTVADECGKRASGQILVK